MASVSGVTSSNASSIYGNRNVLSGLASGMDTESMIQNAVSGLQTKITSLEQSKTMTQWKMEGYRNLTDTMVQFSRKYTSYTSSTNLLSPSFFSKAVLTSSQGANADFIIAGGKSTSNIQINGVQNLATAARYTVGATDGILSGITSGVVTGEKGINLAEKMDLSNLSGAMNFTYGGKSISINFSETEVYKDAEELKKAIVDKLAGQKVSINNTTYSADKLIDVKLEGGKITLSDKKATGNDVYLNSASSQISKALGLGELGSENKVDSFAVDYGTGLSRKEDTLAYLSGKSMTINLNGVSKKFDLPEAKVTKDADGNVTKYTINGEDCEPGKLNKVYLEALQKSVKEAFGEQVTVKNAPDAASGELKLQFSAAGEGNTLTITSTAGDALGLGGMTATSYLNTGKTLKDLFKEDQLKSMVNEDGLYDLTINGKKIGSYTKDTALESILLDINNNAEAGVSVSYSKVTNQFAFSAKETGSAGQIDIQSDTVGGKEKNLAVALFGVTDANNVKKGEDAVISVTINDSNMVLKRSSNNFDLDGMSITLKGTFNSDTADLFGSGINAAVEGLASDKKVTFKTEADAEKIIGAVKNMIADYNEMVTNLKEAFSTMPNYKYVNSGERYQPLTDADKEGMSESAIKAYEEKAKQGILFGDSDLSSMYNKLRSAFSPSGTAGSYLRSIGITTNYSEGLTTVELDEDKLRDALAANPDAVKDAFTKTQDTGGTNGIMQTIKNTLDAYSGTEGAYKGILINKAGSKYAALSLLDNSLQKSVDNIEDQITKWQNKIADKVDYYTRKFSAMEQLVAQMNSQSSYLQSMMMGGS